MVGDADGRLTVVEKEDGLELRPRRTEKPKPTLLRPGVRALVGENGLGFVGLDAQRGHDPRALALDAVGADVVLAQRPHGGLVVPHEHPFVEPGPEEVARFVLRVVEREVDDVVRITLPIGVAQLRSEHVVRGSCDRRRRARVADGAKRGHVSHDPSVPRGGLRLQA